VGTGDEGGGGDTIKRERDEFANGAGSLCSLSAEKEGEDGAEQHREGSRSPRKKEKD